MSYKFSILTETTRQFPSATTTFMVPYASAYNVLELRSRTFRVFLDRDVRLRNQPPLINSYASLGSSFDELMN